ncbi:MAG TPA: phosphatase PAP2 family protein [candidate division Zixibacteria bacterium]
METITNLDTQLFYFLNLKFENHIFDLVMPILTNLAYWRIPLLLAWIGLMIFGKRKGRIVGILVILVVTIGDQVCNQIIKPWVGRIRPCNVLEGVHLLINCTKSFSFPSSHATNLFSSSFLFSYFYRRWTSIFLMIALLVSYSRIYVGVHYPLDVLGGMVLGFLVTLLVLIAYKSLEKYFLEKR